MRNIKEMMNEFNAHAIPKDTLNTNSDMARGCERYNVQEQEKINHPSASVFAIVAISVQFRFDSIEKTQRLRMERWAKHCIYRSQVLFYDFIFVLGFGLFFYPVLF